MALRPRHMYHPYSEYRKDTDQLGCHLVTALESNEKNVETLYVKEFIYLR